VLAAPASVAFLTTVPFGLLRDADDIAGEEIDKKYSDAALVAGALPIDHHGCALRDWLVLTRLEASRAWQNERGDQGTLNIVSWSAAP
jgi:hypothetical protein